MSTAGGVTEQEVERRRRTQVGSAKERLEVSKEKPHIPFDFTWDPAYL